MERPIIGVGTLTLPQKAKDLVNRALDNNRLSYGPMSQEFETRFAEIHGTQFGVISNSGTSALQIALGTLKEMHGWPDDAEIIVPSVTFVATINVVLHCKLVPVIVDVEPIYYSIDPELIEAKISDKTRAIMPVHLFGQPADMAPIKALADKYNLKIVEDSCETMFANYNGASVGSLSDISCFSTYVAHLLTTGVGGLSLTNNPDYAVQMRSLVNHGRDSIYVSIDDDKDLTEEELKMVVARRFSFTSVGYSFRITEMEAALGLAQLDDWETMIAQRRANARYLSRELACFSDKMQLPAIRPGSEHSFMMFPIVLHHEHKARMVNFLEQRGIQTRDMLPITNQPVYDKVLDIKERDYPVAKWINDNGFYIGCHQDLKETDLAYIVEVFERYWRQQTPKETSAATPQREKNTLIVLAKSDWQAPNKVTDDLPTELFDEVLFVCLDAQMKEVIAPKAETHGATVVELDHQNIIQAILTDVLPVIGENIVVYVADGRHDVYDVARLLLQLERGFDMVVASRFLQGGSRQDGERAQTLPSAGNRVFTLLANLLFYGNLSDSLTSFRAIRRSRLTDLQAESDILATTYKLSIESVRRGWRVSELPTVEQVPDPSAELLPAWRSVFPLTKVLWREWRTHRKNTKQ